MVIRPVFEMQQGAVGNPGILQRAIRDNGRLWVCSLKAESAQAELWKTVARRWKFIILMGIPMGGM
ncbi:MAG: hypothetical protein KDK23_14065 [Leptospiraceae bacterium]|nr:hypothetical protein [Leptospiraceae bacterium]